MAISPAKRQRERNRQERQREKELRRDARRAEKPVRTTTPGVDPDIVPLTTAYVHAISLGLPGGLAYFALRFMSEGIGRTRPIMYCAFTGLAINVALNYVLLFGKLGFRRL